MRTLLLIGLAIGGAFMAGWFTIERDGDKTRIEINKTEIRNDTRQAIDKGRDLLDQREQERLAREQQQQSGYPAEQGNWPPQAAPIQDAGYAGYPAPNQYNNQNGYGGQPYGSQPAPGGYNPSYPAPGANQQAPAQQPRWTEMPPPWQQQTR
ncbi:hypothetical protein [Aporhodopirellula aestuarii]|uniref:Uncharacterized protein n=1 Tax=Aporhodopirellula aestuarii TaxID=2950107 RepID=A0ABT0U8T0_9BACT|nr:hypothetical protein [Aporhodopirellula aestuarii]MCM2372818.1 hypothetical protein [Aporhodopirellula aestuarii]